MHIFALYVGVGVAKRIPRFARIGNSSDSGESSWHAVKIGVSIANDSRESIRATKPTDSCHFFCTPGNSCATPIVNRGEGSFSYQVVSTKGS